MFNKQCDSLVEISEQKHKLKIDLVYATPHNFTGKIIYQSERCLLHKDAESRLLKASEIARLAGFTLKILDAYRPPKAHAELWKNLSDPRYVADINIGSNHSRGVALDVTLLDSEGEELNMGTAFDSMEEDSHHGCPGIPNLAHRNRLFLLGIMLHAGFLPIETEWWHYELPGALNYPIVCDDTDS